MSDRNDVAEVFKKIDETFLRLEEISQRANTSSQERRERSPRKGEKIVKTQSKWILVGESRLKMRPKKVTFLLFDHWLNAMHMIERWLDVAVEHEVEGDRFYAHQYEVDAAVEAIKNDPTLIEKLKLAPKGFEVDASLHDVLMAWKDSVVRVKQIEERDQS